jgi:uncharacterized membrane protein YraQ (UPF0718 family)
LREKSVFILLAALFLAAYMILFGHPRVWTSGLEALLMLQEYVREHVLFCLVPAFFIAGAIAVFISGASVIKYLGPAAKKWLSYSVASVSGSILAVCSCTVLPLFAGIYTRGAGIGPAATFLYSGPAINVLAIILTARVLGLKLGVGRAVGAILFSVIIGLLMHLIFHDRDGEQAELVSGTAPEEERSHSLGQSVLYFASMVGILIFANWARPSGSSGPLILIYTIKWYLTGALVLSLALMLIFWFQRSELKEWCISTWTFARQMLPLLFVGVMIAGFLLGRPGHEAMIPSRWVVRLVGGNSFFTNLFASVAGAFMYFATLTEVPILQGLLGAGMGQGPALALLLAGPALSLPNMLVIRSVMGTSKTLVYIVLVVVMATISGLIFGHLSG